MKVSMLLLGPIFDPRATILMEFTRRGGLPETDRLLRTQIGFPWRSERRVTNENTPETQLRHTNQLR